MLACPGFASYTYVVDSYGPIPDLYGTETLLMIDEGGDDMITLWVNSSATIQGTSALQEFFGGIWELNLADNSSLNFSGGELRHLDIGNNATTTLSGGRIDYIESGQLAWKWDYGVDPPVVVPNLHIEILCRDW